MLFIDNKYTNTYFNLIASAKNRGCSTRVQAKEVIGYCEEHHIIPSALGGSNERENKVFLTAREHFIVHWLLTKMTIGKSYHRMVHAFHSMQRKSDGQERYDNLITSRAYLKNKQRRSEILSVEMSGTSNPMYGLTKELSPNYQGKAGGFKGHSHTEKSKDQTRSKLLGVPKSDESNRKRSVSHTGKKQSNTHRENNREARKQDMISGTSPLVILVSCIFCRRTNNIVVFKRECDCNCWLNPNSIRFNQPMSKYVKRSLGLT